MSQFNGNVLNKIPLLIELLDRSSLRRPTKFIIMTKVMIG
jgi:hypothetical protein